MCGFWGNCVTSFVVSNPETIRCAVECGFGLNPFVFMTRPGFTTFVASGDRETMGTRLTRISADFREIGRCWGLQGPKKPNFFPLFEPTPIVKTSLPDWGAQDCWPWGGHRNVMHPEGCVACRRRAVRRFAFGGGRRFAMRHLLGGSGSVACTRTSEHGE